MLLGDVHDNGYVGRQLSQRTDVERLLSVRGRDYGSVFRAAQRT